LKVKREKYQVVLVRVLQDRQRGKKGNAVLKGSPEKGVGLSPEGEKGFSLCG